MQTATFPASAAGSPFHLQHLHQQASMFGQPSPQHSSANPSPQLPYKSLAGTPGHHPAVNGVSPAHHGPSPATNAHHSPNGKHSPERGTSSPPKTGNSSADSQPGTSTLPAAAAPSSAGPKRKKQKIEYIPWSKPATESVGGFSLGLREQTAAQVYAKNRRRTVHDLGK